MKNWTPEQITALIAQIGFIVGAIVALIQSIKGNINSVPKDTVHQMVNNPATTTDSNNTIEMVSEGGAVSLSEEGEDDIKDTSSVLPMGLHRNLKNKI